MSKVTAREIASLEQQFRDYHSKHADRFGPQESCTEMKCVEVRLGIEWLRKQLDQLDQLDSKEKAA